MSPLFAVRYQIMIMCMLFGTAGISAGIFPFLMKPAEPRETDYVIHDK